MDGTETASASTSPSPDGAEPFGNQPAASKAVLHGWRVLLIPWGGVLRPQRAAESALLASAAAFWSTWLIHAGLFAVALVFLTLWNATTERVWHYTPSVPPPPSATAPASAVSPPSFVPPTWESELRMRSLADVWAEWHSASLISPAELMLLLVPLGLLCANVLFALLSIVQTHRHGSLAASLRRNFRVATASLGLALCLVFGTGLLIVVASHLDAIGAFGRLAEAAQMLTVLSVAAGAALLLAHLGRAIRAARDPSEPPLPLRCVTCGYELTMREAHELCPECATPVKRSTAPQSRPGLKWDNPARRFPSGIRFVRMTWSVLAQRDFYRRLRMRNGNELAERFARNTWWIMFCVGWVSMQIVVAGNEFIRFHGLIEGLLVPTIACSMVTIVCLLAHRGMGTLAGLYWTLAGYVPDTRWAAKVVAYEAAFMWLPCLWGGLFLCAMLKDEDFVHRLIGSRMTQAMFGVPPEPVLLIAGWVALQLLWVWRLLRIGRQIRWSNF